MKGLAEYILPIKGLKEGKHTFGYEIGKEFFAFFENQEYEDGDITLNVILTKGSRHSELELEYQGYVNVFCDRCLEPLQQNISGYNRIMIKYGEEYREVDDELIEIVEDEGILDIAPLVMELFVIALPLQCVHEDLDDCNPEMLKKLEELEVKESNVTETDSRWDALKKLKDNN